MSAEHQRTVARRIVKEILEEQRPDVIPELFAPHFHSHDWGPQYSEGLAGIQQLIAFSKQAFVNAAPRCS